MAEYTPDVLEIGADSIVAARDVEAARNLLGHCTRLNADAERAKAKLERFLAEQGATS